MSGALIFLKESDIKREEELKVASFIEKGLFLANSKNTKIQEVRTVYLGKYDNIVYCCALGIALVGRFSDADIAVAMYSKRPKNADEVRYLAKLIGCSRELANMIEEAHAGFLGVVSDLDLGPEWWASQIASALKKGRLERILDATKFLNRTITGPVSDH